MVGYVAMISPENLRASALGFCSAITFVLGNDNNTNQGSLFLDFFKLINFRTISFKFGDQ